MSRPRRWLSRILFRQEADTIEYVLLLVVLLCGAVATGTALAQHIGHEFGVITNGF